MQIWLKTCTIDIWRVLFEPIGHVELTRGVTLDVILRSVKFNGFYGRAEKLSCDRVCVHCVLMRHLCFDKDAKLAYGVWKYQQAPPHRN